MISSEIENLFARVAAHLEATSAQIEAVSAQVGAQIQATIQATDDKIQATSDQIQATIAENAAIRKASAMTLFVWKCQKDSRRNPLSRLTAQAMARAPRVHLGRSRANQNP